MVLLAGLIGYPFLGASLLPVLAAPFWIVGIIPCVILHILLVLAPLALLPPIALAAFVLGQGSILLLGKILGIKMILIRYKRIMNKNLHGWHHGVMGWDRHPVHQGWDHQPIHHDGHHHPIQHLTGWKSWTPFHHTNFKHYGDPFGPQLNFFKFKPIGHIKTNHKPYGFFEGWKNGGVITDEHSSDWFLGPVPNHDHKEETGTEAYYPEYSEASAGYSSPIGLKEHSGTEDDEEHNQPTDPTPQDDKYDRESHLKKFHHRNAGESSLSPETASFIRSAILKLNSNVTVIPDETDAEATKKFLNEQFSRDLLLSMAQGTLPDFVPFPSDEVTRKRSTSKKNSDREDENELVEKVQSQKSTLRSLFDLINILEPTKYVPKSFITWLIGSTTTGERRRTRSVQYESDVDLDDVSTAVKTDIKNLFKLVSMFDIGGCIEKLVCEIHSKPRDRNGKGVGKSYERNIVTAFRIMESIMPDDAEEHVVKYRSAASFGKGHKSPELCVKTYATCSIHTSQLVKIGSSLIPS